MLIAVIVMGLGAIRSVVVPFVIALILAAVTEPLVLALERRKVPHLLSTVISMLFAVGPVARTRCSPPGSHPNQR